MKGLGHLLSHAARQSIPLDVVLEITHHCNYRCQHCYIPDFSASDGMTTERILRLLKELSEMGTLYLTLSGGEMFLRKDWFDIAARARQLGFALRLFSNGSRINQRVADQVQQLGVEVEITLFSMDAEVFDGITQRPGSHGKTLRGIELLREREVEVLIKTPVMTLNRAEIPRVKAYADQVGARFQSFASISAKKDGDPSTIDLRLSNDQLLEYYQGPFSGCHSGPLQRDIVDDEPLCAAASRFCNITSSGDVMACNILPGSGGNLNQLSFREIWEDSPWLNQVRSIRKDDLHTCKSCERLSYCGRCHAQALVEDNDLYGPSTAAQQRADLLERVHESFAV